MVLSVQLGLRSFLEFGERRTLDVILVSCGAVSDLALLTGLEAI